MSTTCSPRRVATRMYVLAVLPSLFALSLRGDTIELKTGEKIDCRFKQATSAGVVMEVGGQSITVPIARVRAIYLGEAPAAKADSTWTDALDALKALQSVTSSGVSYRDYAPRVL